MRSPVCFLAVLLTFLPGTPAGAQTTQPTRDVGTLVITVLKLAEHGQAIVVQTPSGKTYLLDAGEAGDGEATVARFLRARGIERLDGLVLTHAHGDHYRGVPYLLRQFPVQQLLLSPFDASTPAREDRKYPSLAQQIDDVQAIRRLAAERGVKCREVVEGSVLDWDSALQVEVLWPPREPFLIPNAAPLLAINDNSLVLRVAHGNLVFLLPGDVRNAAAKVLVDKQAAKLKADLVVAPHHGMFTSTVFAEAVKPGVVVASCVVINPGHPGPNVPAQGAVKLWAPTGARVYATGWQGNVRIQSDGREMRITCSDP